MKSGDVVFVHAHGYTNNGQLIGGDCGVGSSRSQGLLDKMVNDANLDPATFNLTIKLWTCFSGFEFAKLFFDLATQNGNFPGLVVDGYKGETRTTEPQKSVRYNSIVSTSDTGLAGSISRLEPLRQFVFSRRRGDTEPRRHRAAEV